MTASPIEIVVVDDHSLFRKGLINLIHQVDPSFKVIAEAGHGEELMDILRKGPLPQLVILDISMPRMDGFETTAEVKKEYPEVGVLALTMRDDELSLVKLLRAGANGYLSKDVEPDELRDAITSIVESGAFYTEHIAGQLVNVIRNPMAGKTTATQFTNQELLFIELCCSEDTYSTIADKMSISVKTIENYRGKIFDKMQIKTRIGLVIFALKNNLVSLEQIG